MPTCSEPACPQESHGRQLTTTAGAAWWYRAAQEQYRDPSRLVRALRLAVRADPGFTVAATDLAALEGSQPATATRPLQSWERHHIEVVKEAAAGHVRRAGDLLREHLTAVVCDPVALAIVVGAEGGDALDDMVDRLPDCHRAAGLAG